MLASARYASKIIKASALIGDTRTLLTQWNLGSSVPENLARLHAENLLGKSSRSRLENVLPVFRQRYMADPAVLAGLVVLAHAGLPAPVLDTILLHLTLASDALLADCITDLLAPAYARGMRAITPLQVQNWVRAQVDAGKTERPWGPATVERVAQGLLATLRDFGVLHGKIHKYIAPPLVPVESFAFIALLRYRAGVVGERLLHDAAWGQLMLNELAVERSFVASHQEQLVEFYAAGRAVRISFPSVSPEEYAHALAQRAYSTA